MSYLTPAFSEGHKLAEGLGNPCILGGRQRQERERKIEVATTSLPSRGPTSGRKCYLTLAFWGVPNAKQGGGNHN